MNDGKYMQRVFTIPGRLEGLNAYTNAQRTNPFVGAKMKKEQTRLIALSDDVRNAVPIPDDAYPVTVKIDWYEPNKRRDPDNIVSAKKYILDGLQEAGIIRNDGWSEIGGFTEMVYLSKDNPRVEITLIW